ncbi:hypothetical protein T05_2950, partial [Trichinella murrelli]
LYRPLRAGIAKLFYHRPPMDYLGSDRPQAHKTMRLCMMPSVLLHKQQYQALYKTTSNWVDF